MVINILCIFGAYLVGSLSSAVIVCKLRGLPDPRSQGSFNPGATNVLRIGGKIPAIITMLCDGCKGFIPTLLVRIFGFPDWVIGAVMLASLLGHIWPVFFEFKGGKGVATAMGAFLGLAWPVGSILISIWALVIVVTRISSLGAIVAIILAPIVGGLFLHNIIITIIMCVMSLLLLYRHKNNIVRLWRGSEGRV